MRPQRRICFFKVIVAGLHLLCLLYDPESFQHAAAGVSGIANGTAYI
jgi:hypothetical protein